MNKTTGNILLIISVIVLLFLGRMFSTRYYTAMWDENLYFELAQTFKSTGILGMPSTEGNGVRSDVKTYWITPVYPLSLSSWFFIAAPSLSNARLFSNIIACFALLFFYLLARRLCSNAAWAGICTLLLATDIQFFFTINYVRPEILAIAFSFASFYFYWIYIQTEGGYKKNLFIAWIVCNLGMMTHPIAGSIGFITILIHLLLVRSHLKIERKVFFYLFLITLCFVGAWSIYILQDIQAFGYQFFDSQVHRKVAHFDDSMSKWRTLYHILFPATLHNLRPLRVLNALLFYTLIFYSFKEKKYPYAALFVLLTYLISNVVVEAGNEFAYMELNIPFYYLSLCFIIGTVNKSPIINFFKLTEKLRNRLNYLWFVLLGFLLINSFTHVVSTISEIRYSPRASSYDPSTLAYELIQNTASQKTLGFMCIPDCYDLLSHSGHFKKVNRIAWTRFKQEELKEYILKNDYLATTESFLDPSGINRLSNCKSFTTDRYKYIIENYYQLEKQLQLEGGGTTMLWKRKPDFFSNIILMKGEEKQF